MAERDREDEAGERAKDDCGWKNSDIKTPGNRRQKKNPPKKAENKEANTWTTQFISTSAF